MKILFNNKSLNLIKRLTICEFKLRDQGTVLGFFWTLLYPLLMFAVLYIVFTKWMGTRVDKFPAYLLIGVVQWNFFATATTNAVDILHRKSNLVRDIKFPKEILVVSSVLSIFISHLIEIGILFLFLFITGVHFSASVFFLAPIVCIQFIFILGVSLILSTAYVYFRDIGRIWEMLVRIGFFLTPIFYPLSIIEPFKRRIVELNPMTQIINSSRACLLYNEIPSFGKLSLILLFSLIILVLGYLFFKKKEYIFAELL